MLVTSIFSFSYNVFHTSQQDFNFSLIFILLSANAFNLDKSKNVSCGKELKNQAELLVVSSCILH